MSCGCKNTSVNTEDGKLKNNTPLPSIGAYILKVLAFLLLIVGLPIINLFIIWFIFRTLVLNREVNIKPLLTSIGARFKNKEDEEEENYYNLTENDVELVDVEIITNTSK